jgi:hypothetical protein
MSISKKLMTTGATGDTYVDDVFSTYLYTGQRSATNYNEPQTIVNGVDLDGKGGLVWIKGRTAPTVGGGTALYHSLFDTERGTNRSLSSDRDVAETNPSSSLTSFNSDGFDIGESNVTSYQTVDFASWTFRKAPSFFDVVTYVGDGSYEGHTIPHNLGAEVGMIIIKALNAAEDWVVYHRGSPNPNTKYLRLNSSGAESSGARFPVEPTSSNFTVAGGGEINFAGYEYVAYLFAHDDSDEGLIQCGSYTGTGNSNGPEIDLGWEPQWLMIKSATTAQNWILVDTMRGTDGTMLKANEPDTENNQSGVIHVGANGFQLLSNNYNVNQGDEDYIYMAIRRPNKPAEEFEADELFAMASRAESDGPDKYPFFSGFPVDMGMMRSVTDAQSAQIGSRFQGGRALQTAETSAEYEDSNWAYDAMKSAALSYKTPGTGTKWKSWMWRRAPGFFDVVAYEGNGQVGREVPHSLGVAPEMMWIKARDEGVDWPVYSKDLEVSEALYLSLAMARETETFWNNTRPTAEGFSLDANRRTNSASNTYIAYLFASLPGICDIGSYTGTGGSIDIDCGFTNGARWVLIKRTDGAGDWAITTNDGLTIMINLNDTAAQTAHYALSPIPEGFNVTQGNQAGASFANQTGAEYIYMAIA